MKRTPEIDLAAVFSLSWVLWCRFWLVITAVVLGISIIKTFLPYLIGLKHIEPYGQFFLTFILLLINSALWTLVKSGLALIVFSLLFGYPFSLASLVWHLSRHINALLMLSLIQALPFFFLPVALGWWLSLPLQIFLSTIWSVSTCVCIIEKAQPIACMQRSFFLIRDYFWSLFIVFALLMIGAYTLFMLTGYALQNLIQIDALTKSLFLAHIPNALASGYGLVLTAVLYVHLRILKDKTLKMVDYTA